MGNKNKLFKEIVSTLATIAIAIIISNLFTEYIAVRAIVQGDSMYPTLEHEQSIIAYKLDYIFNEPERFDVIIIEDVSLDNMIIIKRIIGLPGETVRIDNNGIIYVNGEVLEENYGYERIIDPGIAIEEITVGKDEYFVLGDNRNESLDSRSTLVGNVNKKEILAKALGY